MPFEVPEGWVWTTGNEIFSPLKSCSPRGDIFIYVDIDAINNKANIIDKPKTIRTGDAPSRASRYTQAGDVLFSMVRPYLRNIAIVPENGWIASTGFYVCSPTKLLLSQYCFYLMLSDYVVDGLNKYMKGDNSPSINNNHITSWLYPIPPLAEQQRIVAEIKHWFALIDQLEQDKDDLQATIKQAKSKILDLAIHGKLVAQDPNDEPAIELLKRINPDFTACDNEHYTQLPEGWSMCKMKQITNIINGKSQKNVETPNGIYPIYGSGGVIGRSNQHLCIAGSTIIGRKGTINNPIFVEEHFWNVDTAFGLKANDALLDKYLYYFCLSFDFSKLDKSTAMPSLTKASIGDVLIPIPPYQEQKRIISKIDTVLDTMNEILESL